LIVLGFVVVSCGGDDARGGVDIPEGATFCSVFTGEWRDAVNASPVVDPDAPERAAHRSEVLAALAPDEIAVEAQHHARYARDLANGATSSGDTLTGSGAFIEWAGENC
jgi:hypothetical protein